MRPTSTELTKRGADEVGPRGSDAPPRTDGGDRAGGGGCECEHTVFTPLKLLILMLLKVKDTSVMLKEGGIPGGRDLGPR